MSEKVKISSKSDEKTAKKEVELKAPTEKSGLLTENKIPKESDAENTVYHSKASFEVYREHTRLLWVHLPDSVIGTLIYFLLVEHNCFDFQFFEVIRCLLFVGFPVYFTFFLQITYVYQLWIFIPNFSDDNRLCKTDWQLEIAAISVFFIFLFPSVHSIVHESYIILVGDQVCQKDEETEAFLVTKLHSPMIKRIFLWFCIVAVELSILVSVFIVGCIFIMTSTDTSDLVLASVAVCFIMDIDNMAREAFQRETISEHVDDLLFQTKLASALRHNEKKKLVTEETLDPDSIAAFSSIDKAALSLSLSLFTVFCLRGYYCYTESFIDDHMNPAGGY